MKPDPGGIRLGFHPINELRHKTQVSLTLSWASVSPSAQVDEAKWPQDLWL